MSDRQVLRTLVTIGRRRRMTPIVDDDFPAMRDEFDRELDAAARHLSIERLRVVCLCGSTRFYDEFQSANYRETMAGRIVLSVGFYPHCSERAHGEAVGCTVDQKRQLDELHLRKIDLADEVLVLNVGGYIGESTRRELEHAKATGKAVRYLEPVN